MKRLLPLLLVLACSQRPSALTASLSGVHGLALIDDLILTTSTDRNELRALNLTPTLTAGRQWLQAPNPLEPLSISVLPRPSGLAYDVHWAPKGDLEGGTLVGGPYAYAISAGSPELSIVAGTRDRLYELKRLPTAAPVTAMAAWFDVATQTSTLYFATLDGPSGLLYRLQLEGPDLLRAVPVETLTARVRVVSTFPGEVVTALLALGQERLALATRVQQGAQGRTVVLDTASLAQLPLQFPGPVRSFSTHPAAPPVVVDGVQRAPGLTAGQRIFGILSEEVCGGFDCGGVVAVDAATGERSRDSSGEPMPTLIVGSTLPTSVTVAPGLRLPGVGQFQLLGMIASSNGNLLFFDAAALRYIDVTGTSAPVFTPVAFNPGDGGFLGADGGSNFLQGPVEDDLTTTEIFEGPKAPKGGLRQQRLVVVTEARLPGLAQLPIAGAGGGRFALPGGFASRAQVGDSVIYEFADRSACAAEAVITAVEAAAAVAPDRSADCPGAATYSLRATSAQRFVVLATLEGYLGRVAANARFTYAAPYFFHYDDYVPGTPVLSFEMGAAAGAGREDRWTFSLVDNFTPFLSTVSANSVGCSTQLPGDSIFYPGGSTSGPRIFVGYPSSNALMELDPSNAGRPLITFEAGGAACWR